MKKIFAVVLSCAALFTACNKADTPSRVDNDSRIVKFDIVNPYSFQTKVAIANDAKVAIYANDPINASNVAYNVYGFSGTEGILDGTDIKWGVEQFGTNNPSTFFAMYPYADSPERDSFSESVALAYTIDNEEYAKDFLVGVKEMAPGIDMEHPNSVEFELKHPFAMLRYVITNVSDDAIRKVEIYGVHKTGDLAYATAAVTATGEALAAATAVEMPSESVQDNVHTYYSVIVPEAGINPTIKITTWTGATSTYSLATAQDFVAGNKYTATITYNHSHPVQSTGDRTIAAGFAVTDWNASNVTAGTEADYTSSTDEWPIIKGEGFGITWDGGIRMACVGENSYRTVITIAGTGTDPVTAQFKVYTVYGNAWYGCGSSEEVDGWTKYESGNANISVTAEPNAKFTVYYYADNHEIWVKAGEATR